MVAAGVSVVLRELESADIDAVHALLSNFDVVRYMLFPLCSRAESGKLLAEAIAEFPAEPYRGVSRAILDAGSGEMLGMCGVTVVRGSSDGELWYLLEPAHWGKGVATQAATAALAMGFDAMKLHRIFATCLPENPASIRVLEKIGMRREGFLVRNLNVQGEWRSSHLFAILDEEWRAAATPPSTPPAERSR